MTWLIKILDQVAREGYINIAIHYAGSDSKQIQDIAKGAAIRVIDYSEVPHDEALKIQQDSDLLVALTWNEPNSLGILSGKFFEYMAANKPIISMVTGSLPDAEITRMVRQLRLGIACEEATQKSDEERLKNYILLQYQRKMRGDNLLFEANTYEIEKFSYTNLTLELEKICRDLVG